MRPRFSLAALILALAAVLASAALGARPPTQSTTDRGEWIRLAGTDVYCQAYVPKGGHGRARLTYDCAVGKGNSRPRTYGVEIGAWGVEVVKYDNTGRSSRLVHSYLNPAPTDRGGESGLRPGNGGAIDPDVTVRLGSTARLGATDVFCGALTVKGERVLGCARYASANGGWKCCLGRTYLTYISARGVVVSRNSAGGRAEIFVKEFDNA